MGDKNVGKDPETERERERVGRSGVTPRPQVNLHQFDVNESGRISSVDSANSEANVVPAPLLSSRGNDSRSSAAAAAAVDSLLTHCSHHLGMKVSTVSSITPSVFRGENTGL